MAHGGARIGAGRKTKDEENRISDKMRPYADEAINCLVNIIRDEKGKANDKISASKIIIEYTYGKPKETIDSNVTLNNFDIKELFSIDKTE